MRVGILGGTFNPPHHGHLHISSLALQRLNLHRVIWLINNNPLKDRPPPPFQRLQLAQRLLQSHPRIIPWTPKSPPTHTYPLLKRLLSQHPDVRFVFILGADAFAQIHLWLHWKRLLNLLPILVAPRPNSPKTSPPRIMLRPRSRRGVASLLSQRPPAVGFLHAPPSHLSSSNARSYIDAPS